MENNIAKKLVEHYGKEAQLRVAIEDLNELAVALSHFERKRQGAMREVFKETADVLFMIDQLPFILGIDKMKQVYKIFDAFKQIRELNINNIMEK